MSKTIAGLALLLLAPFAFALHAQASPDGDPQLDPRTLTPYLFDAARAGEADVLEALVARGVDLEAVDARGFTALMLAAYNRQPETVARALALGADPNAGDGRGNTALMGALFQGDDASARLLVDAGGIDLDRRNRAGQTALMFAALFARKPMIELLVARGGDLRATDAAGQDALALARHQGDEETIALIGALLRANGGS